MYDNKKVYTNQNNVQHKCDACCLFTHGLNQIN